MINILIVEICVAMFIASVLIPQLYYYFALWPTLFINMPWQIVMSIFMHGSITHLLVNMFVLFIFGTYLERIVGSKNYLLIFLTSGIVGNLAYILYAYLTGDYAPSVGASGAIFGVMGALAILAPHLRVVVFPLPVPISIKLAVIIFALIDLILLPYTSKTGIAHITHLAGLITGLILGKMLRDKIYSIYY
ncbi:rhomboid family intramembrane serine protease [Methanocaldococcus fervens]|uniref:Rhomboid family protein n=1 Tax=Methanocaldococcus fervens (strain DSM 4213 / JCM 15782 / AG86) TaxID=573064 RepID=C7P677_METFA|nr:rhomboid family intramembrane serine protease [Methanocaldococcus fervens]ACV24059.1 Rhomboid family protein [Methanocaldococcus fervens AG86]